MIATHEHTISGRPYSLVEIQGGTAKYKDGSGAIFSCAVNSGLMRPHRDLEAMIVEEKAHTDRRLAPTFHGFAVPVLCFHTRRFFP